MTILEKLRYGSPRQKQSGPTDPETRPAPPVLEVNRTVPPFSMPLEPGNIAELYQERVSIPEPAPAEPEVPPTRSDVLRLTPNHEAEQLAQWIIKQIESRFQEGVVVIAGECIADGLDTERVNVTVDHEAFRMLTKSAKRRTVLHRYITQKLVEAKRDLYVRHHLHYALADQFQYYRISDTETGAFTEPLGFLIVEQFDVHNGRPLSQTPQRFYFPLISEETLIGRSETEALSGGLLTPGVGYVELPTVEGLSVCHLSVSISSDGLTFWVRYLGNRENQAFHFHGEDPLVERVKLTAPVVYGPSTDRPYVRFQFFSARPPDESGRGTLQGRSIQGLQAIVDEAITALDEEFEGPPMEPEPPPSAIIAAPVPPAPEKFTIQDLDVTLPLIFPSNGKYGISWNDSGDESEKAHSLLGVTVLSRRLPTEEYQAVFQEIYPLRAPRVILGRQPLQSQPEEDTQYITLRFGETLSEVNRTISRSHILLSFEDDELFGRALSTRNHVFVLSNGQREVLSSSRLELLKSRKLLMEGRPGGHASDIRVIFEIVNADED